LLLAAALGTAAAWPTVVQASVSPTWLIKGQDLEPFGSGSDASVGLLAQASKDGATLPAIQWQLCGVYNGVTYGLSDYTRCAPGDTLVTENFYALRNAINAGYRGTIVYDIESWDFTPSAQSSDPVPWIRKSVQFAKANGVSIIVSPGGTLGGDTAAFSTATQYGATYIALQSQGKSTLSAFESFVHSSDQFIGAERGKYGTDTGIIVGLATNVPAVHSLSLLNSEFDYAWGQGLNSFWLNANNWLSENECTAADGGPGCPEIGVQFLATAVPPPPVATPYSVKVVYACGGYPGHQRVAWRFTLSGGQNEPPAMSKAIVNEVSLVGSRANNRWVYDGETTMTPGQSVRVVPAKGYRFGIDYNAAGTPRPKPYVSGNALAQAVLPSHRITCA
jgi:hypothetical protein